MSEVIRRGADGKLLRGPEHLLVRDCTEACACATTPICDNCPRYTPSQFHVTFSGITLCAECAECEAAGMSAQMVGSVFGGTFVLSRNGACAWTTDPSLVSLSGTRFGSSDCSGESEPITFAIQQVRISPSQWQLQITDDSNTILVFNAIVNVADCCQAYTADNTQVNCDCDDGSTLAVGTGGTATVTPC